MGKNFSLFFFVHISTNLNTERYTPIALKPMLCEVPLTKIFKLIKTSSGILHNAYGFLMCGLSCSSLSTRNKDNRMHETMNTNVNPHSRKPMLAGVLLFFVIGSCLVAPLELFLNCQWLIANCPVVIAAAELYCLFVLFLVCLSKLTNLKLL